MVEDGPVVIKDYHLARPEEEIEYFYEDIVDEGGSEGSWQPQDDTYAPGKNFETETYYVTDGEHNHNFQKEENYIYFVLRFSGPLSCTNTRSNTAAST